MAGVKTWLAGFVYRGRAPWEMEPPAYHVEVGEYVEVDGRDPVMLDTKVMTPTQAEAAGFDLAAVISGLNAGALAANEGFSARAAQAEATIGVLSERIAALEAALEAATTETLTQKAERSSAAMQSEPSASGA